MAESQRIPNRFAVFGGQTYYARGAFHDLVASADTLEQAKQLAAIRAGDEDEWWQIFDLVEWRVVAQSPFQAYGTDDKIPDLNK